MVIFSGSAFASPTKSRAVSAFTAGLTKKNIEAVPIRPIGVKSRTGSYCTPFWMAGMMVCGMSASSRV
jgi:hypothetical protein